MGHCSPCWFFDFITLEKESKFKSTGAWNSRVQSFSMKINSNKYKEKWPKLDKIFLQCIYVQNLIKILKKKVNRSKLLKSQQYEQIIVGCFVSTYSGNQAQRKILFTGSPKFMNFPILILS